jgi:hypothetical protein
MQCRPHSFKRSSTAGSFLSAIDGGEGVEGFRVVTAVGEKRVGRIVGAEEDYYVVKRSFGRGRYPLPKRQAEVDSERRRVLMHPPRKVLFEAPKVRRKGELDPATDGYYRG